MQEGPAQIPAGSSVMRNIMDILSLLLLLVDQLPLGCFRLAEDIWDKGDHHE